MRDRTAQAAAVTPKCYSLYAFSPDGILTCKLTRLVKCVECAKMCSSVATKLAAQEKKKGRKDRSVLEKKCGDESAAKVSKISKIADICKSMGCS